MLDDATEKMLVNGSTEVFAVLGCPVRHTLSPHMHNAAFRAMNKNAVYLALEVQPGRLEAALRGMDALGFKGVNVTVPLKEEANVTVDVLDESAKRYGAVNTVSFTEQGLVGASTDGVGFNRGFKEAFGCEPSGLNLLVLGVGGAGRTVALASAEAGAASVTVHDLSAEKVEQVCGEIRTSFPGLSLTAVGTGDDLIQAAQAADAIIQCTTVGMKPGDPELLPAAAFRPGHRVFDLIYSHETPLIKTARAAGADTSGGLGMLLHQGVKSFEIWTGETPPVDEMRNALKKAMNL